MTASNKRSSTTGFRRSAFGSATATNFYKTSYQVNNETTTTKAKETKQATRPFWSYPKEAYTSNRGAYETEHHAALGTFGHNPIEV